MRRLNVAVGWVAGIYGGEVYASRISYTIQAGLTMRIHESTESRAHNRQMTWTLAAEAGAPAIYATEAVALMRLVQTEISPRADGHLAQARLYSDLARTTLARIEAMEETHGADPDPAHAGAEGADAGQGAPGEGGTGGDDAAPASPRDVPNAPPAGPAA